MLQFFIIEVLGIMHFQPLLRLLDCGVKWNLFQRKDVSMEIKLN